MAKRPTAKRGAKPTPKFPLRKEMVGGVVAGEMAKMHRRMHGKRGR